MKVEVDLDVLTATNVFLGMSIGFIIGFGIAMFYYKMR